MYNFKVPKGKVYVIYNVRDQFVEENPINDGDIIYIEKKPYSIRKEGKTFALLPVESRRPL
jgi:DNA helicase TIP49 (TBP-interacting protein)